MTPENITALQSLIQADPALAEQLQSATTIDNAVQLLALAASQKGISVDADAIAEHLEAAKSVHMSDSELEAVAAGLATNGGFAALSIFTMGYGCLFYSVKNSGTAFLDCKTK